MARNTEKSMTRALGRRAAQVVLVGAMAATPLALSTGLAHADTDWDALAQCESSGNWNTNTGNGFGGGLQFTDSTWEAFGGSGSPENASRSEQIAVAERVKAEQGMNAWPTCSKKTGNTDSSANSGSSSSSSSSDSDSDSSSSQSSGSGSSGSSSSSSSSDSDGVGEAAVSTPTSGAASHTVAAGDTLGEIASANGTTAGALASRNGLADPDTIVPGQQLALR